MLNETEVLSFLVYPFGYSIVKNKTNRHFPYEAKEVYKF